jgi:SsrA-binding protein
MDNIKIIAQNKRAFFDYEILDRYEAGLVLTGAEVKSLRLGKCSINESYIDKTHEFELVLVNASITSQSTVTVFSKFEERRNRKLLLHKKEIFKIIDGISKKGFTAVPLKLYFKKGRAKIEIALARGKNNYDKRHDIKSKDLKREQAKTFKNYNIKV